MSDQHSYAGPLLLDVLRTRRRLEPVEIVLLLGGVPADLDACGDAAGDLLQTMRVRWRATQGDPAAPVPSWPPFQLLPETGPSRDDETAPWMTAAPGRQATTALPIRFATLVCELLGGGRRGAGGTLSFSPIPGLGETSNEILRRGMAGGFPDCDAFWSEWVRALEFKPVRGWLWRTPRWLQGRADPGEILNLLPSAPGPTVRLVSAARFRIGRSRQAADWPARVEVRGRVDEEASKRVSRVHLAGQWNDEGPVFRDGDGEHPSANGTTFNGRAIEPGGAFGLQGRGVMELGGAYRLNAIRVPDAGFPGSIDGIPDDAPSGGGAVIFLPLDGVDVARDAVWLRSDVGFVLAHNGRIAWNAGGEGLSAGFFLHRGGRFWLANAGLNDRQLRIDDGPLAPGQIAPLASGQSLQIGALHCMVKVSPAP